MGHAWLCSDLGCVCNSQSSCIVVEEMAPLCATTPGHVLLCKYDNCAMHGLCAVI